MWGRPAMSGLLIGIAMYVAIYYIGKEMEWYENRSKYDFESENILQKIRDMGLAHTKSSKVVVQMLRKAKRVQTIYRASKYRIRKVGKR